MPPQLEAGIRVEEEKATAAADETDTAMNGCLHEVYVRLSGAAENFAHLPRTLSAQEVLSRTQFRKMGAKWGRGQDFENFENFRPLIQLDGATCSDQQDLLPEASSIPYFSIC